MSKSTKPLARSSSFDPRNEGQGVPVRASQNEDGTITYQMDLSTLAAPAEVFVADGVDIHLIDGSYRLAFYMSKLYGNGARALVDIVVAERAAHPFIQSLKSLSRKEGNTAELVKLESEPEKSVSLMANFIKLAQNDTGAVLDFYFASPFSLGLAVKNQMVYYRDVVRIASTERVFFAVVKYFLGRPE